MSDSHTAILISDVHMSNALPYAKPTANGQTDRLEDQIRLWKHVSGAVQDHAADAVYILGDLFNKTRVGAAELTATTKGLDSLDAPKFILGGNHDSSTTRGGRYTTEALGYLGADVHSIGVASGVIEVADWLRFWPLEFMALDPALENLEIAQEAVRCSSSVQQNYLLTHLSIMGCEHGGWICDDGVPADLICQEFDRVYSGHFHTHQWFGPKRGKRRGGMYLSAPMHHRADDEGRGAYYWVVKFRKGKPPHQRRIDPGLPKFYQSPWPLVVPEECGPGDYLKITLEDTHAVLAEEREAIHRAVDKLCKDGFRATWRHKPIYHHTTRMKSHKSTSALTLEAAVNAYPDMGDVEIGNLDIARLRRIGRAALDDARAEHDEAEALAGDTASLDSIEIEDFCCFAHATLKLKDRGLVRIGGDNLDSAAADNNGSGKSAIFKAIYWCLFGAVLDDAKGDKVIRDGAIRAKVTVRFSSGWKLERTRSKGAPKVKLIDPDGEAWDGSRAETDAKVSEMVGIDAQTFRNTILYGEGDALRFLKAKDAARKEMFHRILRTTLLGHAHKGIGKQASGVRSKVSEHTAEVSKLEARISGIDVDDIQERANTWATEQTERTRNLLLRAKERLATAKKVRAEKADKSELADLKKKCRTARRHDDAAFTISNEILPDLQEDFHKAGKYQADAEAAEYAALQALQRLKGDKCPLCTSDLSAGEAKDHLRDLRAKCELTRSALESAIEAGEKASSLLTAGKEDLRRNNAKAQGLRALEEKIRDLENAAARREEQADQHMAAARELKGRADASKAEINPFTDQLAKARQKLDLAESEIKGHRRELKTLRLELAHLEFWVRGFSGQGLPSFVLDSAMPHVTKRANHYLEILSDGDIVMKFDTQRELKSAKGEMRDEIGVSWNIEGLDDYAPSKGQFRKMEIATDLSLMDLVASREGTIPDLLCMDECLDGLDGEGTSRVLQLLHSLRNTRGSIFVISHAEDVADVFERSIVARKENGITEVIEG